MMKFRGYGKQSVEISLFVPEAIPAACERWITGRLPGNPFGDLSFNGGRESLASWLGEAGWFLLRGVVSLVANTTVGGTICVVEVSQ
jgi:hypothetical protein